MKISVYRSEPACHYPLVLFTMNCKDVENTGMDTATYAAVVALPRSVVQFLEYPLSAEVDFVPFNLSEIARSWARRFHFTGPCNDI